MLLDIDPAWFIPPADRDCGDWGWHEYATAATAACDALLTHPVQVVNLCPGNDTRYHLLIALGTRNTGVDGRTWPLSVTVVHTGNGWVFDADRPNVLTDDYTADKLHCGISDGWVLGRFITALRAQLLAA